MSSPLREILAHFGIEVDNKELEEGHKHVEGFIGKLHEFAKVAAEAFVIHEVKEFTYGLAEQAEQLEIQARTLGISTDALQKWQFAANLSGVGAETLQVGLQKLQRSAVGAAGKGGDLAAVFTKLGIDVKTGVGGGFKDADQLLTEVAGGIAGLKDPTQQTAIAMQVFGRGGAALLPFLKKGAEGIAELKAEVDELGGGFGEDFIEHSSEMIQNTKRLDFAMTSLKTSVVAPLLPLIAEFAEGASKLVARFKKWVDGTNALKAALVVFGAAGLIKTVIGVAQLATKLGILKNGFRGLLLQILPLVAAFLVLEDVWTFLTGGKSVTGDLIAKFFGKDAPGKVRAFVEAIKETGLADFSKLLSETFSIFTGDKPLDTKFRELMAFIDGPFRDQLKKDFGEVGEDITLWLELLTGVAGVLNKIMQAMAWIGTHTVNAIEKQVFDAQDGAANEQAKLNAGVAAGKKVATPDDIQAHLDAGPWYMRAFAKIAGFDPQTAVPVKPRAAALPAAAPLDVQGQIADQNVARAPVPYGPPQAPAAQVHNETHLVQNIEAGVPKDLRDAAAEGAKKGVSEGNNLRTKRALVPTAG